MKKLVMLAAVALVAIATQAATVTWKTSTSIKDPDGVKVATGSVTLYVFLMDTESAYNAFDISDASAIDTGAAAGSAVSKATGASYSNSTAYDAGDTIYSAALLVYNDGVDKWYKAIKQTSTVNDLGGAVTFSSLDTAAGSWAKGGGDVPEPTSGLLLVLGGAMLALRRRRA